jgi:hypothetical protein
MSNNTHSLRSFIREVLREGYNVTITGVPVKLDNVRRPRKKGDLEPLSANVVLEPAQLQKLIDDAQSQDNMKDYANDDIFTSSPDWKVELEKRFDLIKERLGPRGREAASLARMLVSAALKLDKSAKETQKEGDDEIPPIFENVIFNLGDTKEHPILLKTYVIPPLFRQLLEFKTDAARGQAVGKGEALAILMFGRDATASQNEADLVIAGKEFAVKYFEYPSSTVETGVIADSEAISRFVEPVASFRTEAIEAGYDKSKLKTLTIEKLENVIKFLKDQKAQKEQPAQPEQAAQVNKEQDDIYEQSLQRWFYTPALDDNCLCFIGGATQAIYVAPRDQMITSIIDFSKAVPILKVGLPAYSLRHTMITDPESQIVNIKQYVPPKRKSYTPNE